MYTNNDCDIEISIRNHLKKGDCYFELYFAEQLMDQQRLNRIFEGFIGVPLPDNMIIKLNFSSCEMKDEVAKVLADKLCIINWPSKVDLDLNLRNNSLTNEGANYLLDLCNSSGIFYEAMVSIDFDNNTGLTADIIGDTLSKLCNSYIEGKLIKTEYDIKKIEFSTYLIIEFQGWLDES